MNRHVALILLVAMTAALPAGADARKPKRKAAHAKVAKGKRGRAHVPAGWGFVRTRRPGRPAPQPAAAPVPLPADPSGPAPASTPTPPPSTVPTANPRSVSVRSTEFAFTLSQGTVSAGDVRVQFDNSRAEDPHQLSLLGNDDLWSTGVQDAGSVTAWTYALRPGVYTLFCPLPEHEARGMRARLTVR